MIRKTLLTLIVALLTCAQAQAAQARFVREIYSAGPYKQCVYDYMGTPVVITIPVNDFCPIVIEI